jgi:uncharacterized Zn finger protein
MMAEFDRTCPQCSADGIPKAVSAERGKFMVTLGCDNCGHTWATERKPDFQLFSPRHDAPLRAS